MNGGYGQDARILAHIMKEKTMRRDAHRTRPRPAHEQVEDIHDDLYTAVYAGDIVKAQAMLYELSMIAPEPLDRRLRLAHKQGRLVA
jgi:hypothetical protein